MYAARLISALPLAEASSTTVWDGRVPPGATRSLISERDPAEHLRRRKVWNRGFSQSALHQYEGIIRDRTVQFVQLLEKMKEPLDLDQWLSYYTCVMLRACSRERELTGKQIRLHG